MGGDIDNFATPGNPVVDITGTTLNAILNFQDKGGSSPVDHPLSQFGNVLPLTPDLVALFQTPLNQFFDQAWSQQLDANGQTMLARTSTMISSQISSSVRSQGGDYTAYGIAVNLPTTGVLIGLVAAPTFVLLSYQLNGVTASFTTTTPYTGGVLPDPSFGLSLDIELLIQLTIPPNPGPFAQVARFNVSNANISPIGTIGAFAQFLGDLISFLSDQSGDIFQTAEGTIDSTGGPVNISQLSSSFASLSAAWQTASKFGFKKLDPFIGGSPAALNMRFTHRVDPAPVIVNAAVSSFPSLFPPQLGTSGSEVQAGGTLNVTGTDFPIGQAAALYIAWDDTTSSPVTESDIRWGIQSGVIQTVLKPRHAGDNESTFAALNLSPNATYVFSVRDQDLLTETPWSDPFTLTTQASNLVELWLKNGGQASMVGTANLGKTGTFSAPILVPSSLAPGFYTLAALLSGATIATTVIQVLGAGQPLTPRIEVIDPTTNTVTTGVEETFTFTLRGEGFGADPVTITIDSAGGQALGTVTAGSSGSFQSPLIWPNLVTGAHQIVAEQTTSGQTLQASVTVNAQPLPR